PETTLPAIWVSPMMALTGERFVGSVVLPTMVTCWSVLAPTTPTGTKRLSMADGLRTPPAEPAEVLLLIVEFTGGSWPVTPPAPPSEHTSAVPGGNWTVLHSVDAVTWLLLTVELTSEIGPNDEMPPAPPLPQFTGLGSLADLMQPVPPEVLLSMV